MQISKKKQISGGNILGVVHVVFATGKRILAVPPKNPPDESPRPVGSFPDGGLGYPAIAARPQSKN